MHFTPAIALAVLAGLTHAQEDEPKKPFLVDIAVSRTLSLVYKHRRTRDLCSPLEFQAISSVSLVVNGPPTTHSSSSCITLSEPSLVAQEA